MNITLVTASFNDEVHGTFNDKKTGCGINLLKPENVTRYRRGGKMTDLGEITCEKCKTKVAKEMIKADQKEMKLILKEEKMKAKRGLEDEGIVPLGNTTAKITKDQSVQAREPEPAPVQKPAFTSTGAPVLDDSLAQFAIQKPVEKEETAPQEVFRAVTPALEPEPAPAPAPAPAPEDDFLAQFAIQKPVEKAEEPKKEEDDFLAQFAVSAPQKEEEPVPVQPAAPPVIDDISAALDALTAPQPAAPAPAPAPVYEAPVQEAPKTPFKPAADLTNEDILNMFAVNQPKPVGTVEVLGDEPETVGRYDNNPNVIDAPDVIRAVAEEVTDSSDTDPAMSDWDRIANQLFGGAPSAPEPAAPVQPEPVEAAPAPAPVQPAAPVIDDISAAISALNTPVQPAAPVIEDIAPVAPVAPQAPVIQDISVPEIPAPKPAAPVLEELAPAAPVVPQAPAAPVIEDIAPAAPVAPQAPVIQDISVPEILAPKPVAPVIDDISAALSALNTPVQPQTPVQPAAPVLEELAPAAPVVPQAPAAPVIEDIAPAAPVAPQAPVIQDISVPEIPAAKPAAPVIDDISAALSALNTPVQPQAPVQPAAPVLEELAPAAPVVPQAPAAPVIKDIAPAAPQAPVVDDAPVLEDINEEEELELISETLEPKAPVIDDISAALSALSAPAITGQAPQPKAPVKPVAPVQSVVQPAAPIQPMVQPVVPVQPMVQPTVPVQPVAPVQPAAAGQTTGVAGAVGQIITVPQLTGYDVTNQPVYAYIQMQIQGYDPTGQPILVPLPGQNIPAPFMPSSIDKNSRLRDAIAAAKEIPTSTREMTPGQRIAAANAANGSPVSANVSKIATNPHARSTSKAFISAISESKEYANQSLTETQGLKQRAPVLASVEDVLSQLGDNSLKEKKAAEAKAQTNVPDFQEFKTPGRTSYNSRTSYPSSRPAAPKPAAPQPDERFMTKAELKAKKKQDKIDAKFQKEMMKRK